MDSWIAVLLALNALIPIEGNHEENMWNLDEI